MKTVKIQAEIPAYLRDALTRLPGSAGKSESDIVADALRDYVDGHIPRLRELKEASLISAKAGTQAESANR